MIMILLTNQKEKRGTEDELVGWSGECACWNFIRAHIRAHIHALRMQISPTFNADYHLKQAFTRP